LRDGDAGKEEYETDQKSLQGLGNRRRADRLIGFHPRPNRQQSLSIGKISPDDPNVNWNAFSEFEVELMAVEATTPLPAEAVARASGYYSAQYPNWPPLPGNPHGLPLWSLGEGIYLLDDRQFDYSAVSSVKAEAMNAMAMEASRSGDNSGGDMYLFMFNAFGYAVDYGTNLWIANFALSSNNAVGILSNTVADITYEIQCKHDLNTDTQWLSAGFVLGSEITNWTALVMNNVSLTNNAFFRIRSWEDDGSGLPLWWQMQYFGTTGIDPYGDPDGDGWNNHQEFQNGTNPLSFNTPPAPQLAVSYDVFSQLANVSWVPPLTPVTSYTVERFDYYIGNIYTNVFYLLGTANSLQDNNVPIGAANLWGYTGGDWGIYSYYQIQAHYAVGDSAWSDSVYVQPDTYASLSLVPGPQGTAYLAVASLPAGTTTLRVTRIDWPAENYWDDFSFNATNDIPVSTSTNGLYLLPASITANPIDAYGLARYYWYVEPLDENGNGIGFAKEVSHGAYSSVAGDSQVWVVPPHHDGRVQLKQNLIFKLRAATRNFPFAFTQRQGPNNPQPIFTFATNYVSASFFQEPERYVGFENIYDPIVNFNSFDFLWPFGENTLFRNFVFSSADVVPSTNWPYSVLGHLSTGVSGNYNDYYSNPSYNPTPLVLNEPAVYQFQLNTTNGGTIPALLPVNSTRWLCSYALDSPNSYYDGTNIILPYLGEIGVWGFGDVDDGSLWCAVAANERNYWGLPFLSVLTACGNQDATDVETNLLYASGQLENVSGYFYSETAQPQFKFVVYDFWSYSPFPESTNFSTSQTSDLLMAGVGGSLNVAGYAKLAWRHGYPGVYGYLGQYFDKAYKMDASGNVTTNITGVLSPYGQFFATEPGPAALVTMPDVDTGERGTCTVYCVSLQLDKNHDGNMDLSFNGPDATSQASPMEFWVNGDNDGIGVGKDIPVPTDSVADYMYGKIRSQRNLEDFARLWICGLPKLPATNGYAITLSMSPASGNPAINLYRAYDTNGSASYLSDTNAAAAQFARWELNGQLVFDYAQKVGTVNPSQIYTLPVSTDGTPDYTHFLFEGTGVGRGQLTMTISQNGNAIAQASAWIDFHNVGDLYEQAAVTDVEQHWPEMVQTNLTSGFKIIHPSSEAPLANQLAVFVHGWRVAPWEAMNFSDTMYKRIYWQGFQGKYAALFWPTRSKDTDPFFDLDYATYNRSEHIAFESGTGAAAYFNDLRSRFPDDTISVCAHSMGNIVMMEALKKLAASSQAPIDNYVLMQAAVPAQCYDTTVTNLPAFISREQTVPTPNTYNNYAAGIGNALRGNMVSFFNPLDFALNIWRLNQGLYISVTNGPVTMKPNTLLGYYTDGTIHLLRTNAWNQNVLTILYGGYYNGPTRSVTDSYEVMPFISRPRCLAVGAQGGVGGEISGGELNLENALGFTANDYDHSGEFNRNIQTPQVQGFYANLVINLFPAFQ
jgi:hypothetical protein